MRTADLPKIFVFFIFFENANSIAIANGGSTNTLQASSTLSIYPKKPCEIPTGWRLVRRTSSLVPENSVVHVDCPKGFNQVGKKEITCLRGGVWDNSFPSCALPRGTVYITGRKFILPKGLFPPISSTRQATEQIPESTAAVTRIPNDVTIEFGRSQTDDNCDAGSIRTFSCPYPFELNGQSYQRCLPDGKWDVKKPTCSLRPPTTPARSSQHTIHLRLPPSTIPTKLTKADTSTAEQSTELISEIYTEAVTELITHGMAQTSSNHNTSENCVAGAMLTHSCPYPYEVDGKSAQTCPSSGKWESEAPKCKLICGRSGDLKIPEIINGKPARVNQIPWQCALRLRTGIDFRIFCGGVLISEKYVLTAAHCVTEDHSTKRRDPNTLLLLFGKHSTDTNVEEGLWRTVSSLDIHPEYDAFTLEGDLGMIKLEEAVGINAMTMPLCLPQIDSDVTFQVGRKGVIAGYGYIDNSGTLSSSLNMVDLPIVSSDRCEASYSAQKFRRIVSDNMFCAGVEEGGKSTCLGDSGGAMAFFENDRFVLEGIVSWGNRDDCAAPGFYAGFVRVRNFLPWIRGYV